MSAEPVSSATERTGSSVMGAFEAPLGRVREWAGPSRRAILLSGSHATGDATWTEWEGRRVSLSDLDLYVVMPSSADCAAAEARARADRPALAAWLLEHGFAAPLEVAFHTRAALERLPARPGTIALGRQGGLIAGDPSWLAHVPMGGAADVPPEEVDLLLENRAFDLLLARAALGSSVRLERLEARHALLKVALELAAVASLEGGEYPDGAAARVAWARANGAHAAWMRDLPAVLSGGADPLRLERLWEAALAWRGGDVSDPAPAALESDWRDAAVSWCAAWWRRSARGGAGAEAEPFARALRFAARARLRRRAREAVLFRSRSGHGPSLASRVRHAARGTPQHRVNAAAAVLLLDACSGGALSPSARSALAALGFPGAGDWASASDHVTRAWDRWVLDGQRTAR